MFDRTRDNRKVGHGMTQTQAVHFLGQYVAAFTPLLECSYFPMFPIKNRCDQSIAIILYGMSFDMENNK